MPLFPQQAAAVRFFNKLPRALNISETGTGKTIPLCVRLAQLSPPKRCLVVVQNEAVDRWVKHLHAWGRRDWQIAVLGGDTVKTRKERVRRFLLPHHVAVINPEGLHVLGTRLAGQYEVLAIDEMQMFKNSFAKASRALAFLSSDAQHVYGLTGSPLTENLIDLYSVLRIVNPSMVDPTVGPWRERYFVFESRVVDGERTFPRWWPKDGTLEALSNALHSISYFCSRESLPVDWPDQIDQPAVEVSLSRDVQRVYDDVESESNTLLRAANVAPGDVRTRMVKLLQIANGWVYDSQKRPLLLGRSTKMEALADLLKKIGRRERVLIWETMPPEFRLTSSMLSQMGIQHACAWGDTKKPVRRMLLAAFNKGRLPVLVAQPRIWGTSQDIYADHAVTFSRTWSGDQHFQKRGRPVRANSKQRRVLFWEIVAKNTIDAACLAAIHGKQDLLKEVMERRFMMRG